MEALLMHRGER